MNISAETSTALASIVLADAGDDASAKGPFKVSNRDDNWLVIGPAIANEAPGIVRRTFYIFVRKSDAEVTGLGYGVEHEVDDDIELAWKRHATPAMIAAWKHRPEVTPSPETLDLYGTLHGGLINQPKHAAAYAGTILGLSDLQWRNLVAVEQQGIWRISTSGRAILDFSRRDGRISFIAP